MKVFDLWPTRVVVDQFDETDVLNIFNNYLIGNDSDWDDLLPEELRNKLLQKVEENFNGEYEIIDGWIRKLETDSHNEFELHCDSHYGGQLVAVLQLVGDENCGGDLVLYDPSWRNPQFTSDEKTKMSNIFSVPFKTKNLVIFPSDVWHKVTAYTGQTKRITFNIILKRVT